VSTGSASGSPACGRGSALWGDCVSAGQQSEPPALAALPGGIVAVERLVSIKQFASGGVPASRQRSQWMTGRRLATLPARTPRRLSANHERSRCF